MVVVINGRSSEVPAGVTVSALLESLALGGKRVAVEVNEHVIPRARHAETTLAPEDRIEIVTFVGGG